MRQCPQPILGPQSADPRRLGTPRRSLRPARGTGEPRGEPGTGDPTGGTGAREVPGDGAGSKLGILAYLVVVVVVLFLPIVVACFWADFWWYCFVCFFLFFWRGISGFTV